MANTVLCFFRTLADYDREKLLQQFALVAKATSGTLNPQALRFSKQKQELIDKLRWRQFTGDICLQRSWTVLTTTRLFLPTTINGELRLSNVYGETSGAPLIGSLRLDTSWSQPTLIELFPPQAHQLLVSSQEPFTLLLQADQAALSTYRFYDSNVYLEICDYLANLAQRALTLPAHQGHHSAIRQMELPWL